MNVVTKDALVTTVESENPNGEFDVILSTDDLDRDNERLHANEWKQPLPERITFDSDHGMSVATTVGSGKPFINEKGQLQVRGTFASTPHAQTVRTLVNEGHITKTSVSFSVHKTQKDGVVQRELLNGAFVAVPANDKAVVLSSKSAVSDGKAFTLDDFFEWKSAQLKAADGTSDAQGATNPTMPDLVQAVHDAAVHLGAMCDGEITDADTGASSGANKSVSAVITKDAHHVLAGLDATLDEAAKLTADIDRKSLPEPVGQALDLLVAAQESAGTLMQLMGVYDPDAPHTSGKSAGSPQEPTEDSTATAIKAAAAEESAEHAAASAKARAFLIRKSLERLGHAD